jgi:hypothetical protein
MTTLTDKEWCELLTFQPDLAAAAKEDPRVEAGIKALYALLDHRTTELAAQKRENSRLYVDIELRNSDNAKLRELLSVMLSKVNRDEIYKHDLVALAMDGAVATDGCHTDVGTKLRLAIVAREAEASELIEALEWCGGSNEFAPGGTARAGWEKGVLPLLRKHRRPTPQTIATEQAEEPPKDEMDERVPLTVEQAMALLDVQDGHVHTFLGGSILIGADWPAEAARQCFEKNGVELAGEQATKMRHGIVSFEGGARAVFFATKEGAAAQVAS